MGGQQSSHAAGAAGAASAASTTKTCYYELLGVPLTATDEEIKKAYRQRALELHPDRNYGDTENSTRRFADVQSAYEVLSDPQERAWYDSHRDAILHDRDPDDSPPEFHNVRITTSDDLLSLTRRFNRAIPMTDEPDGFFAVLRETFDRLAAEEDLACRVAGQAPAPYSRFGGERDTFDDTVKLFYRDWSSFSTAKSFAWEDMFRLSDARDRRERRAMERENKRVREEAAREFNETVLFFVAFVRKRDPRVVMDKRTAAERQTSMKEASAAQAARSRAANQRRLAEMSAPPEVASPAPAQPAEPEFPDTEDDESAEVVEIECVVCNKRFKSENQFEAHERSKKHLKAAQRLRSEMKKDDRLLNPQPAPPPDDQDAASLPDQQDGRAADHEQEVVAVGESNEADGGESAATHLSARLTGTQIGDRVKNDGTDMAADEGHAPHVASSSVDGDRAPESTSTHPSPRLAGTSTDDNAEVDSHTTHEDDDEYASRADVADRLGRDGTSNTSSTTESPTRALGPKNPVEEDTLSGPDTAAVRKKGKAKMRREKKAARQAASAQDTGSALTCASCQETFPSRSKLFSHIKALGHAAPPPPR